MADVGVRLVNVTGLIAFTAVNAICTSCRMAQPVQDGRLDEFGFAAKCVVTSRLNIVWLYETTGLAAVM